MTLSWKIAKGRLFERARLEEECLHFLLLLRVNYALWAICGKDEQGKTRTVDEVLKDITSVSKHADSWLDD